MSVYRPSKPNEMTLQTGVRNQCRQGSCGTLKNADTRLSSSSHPPSYQTWCRACPRRSPSWPQRTSWLGRESRWSSSPLATNVESNPPPATWWPPCPQRTSLCLPGGRAEAVVTCMKPVWQQQVGRTNLDMERWTWLWQVLVWDLVTSASPCRTMQNAASSNTTGVMCGGTTDKEGPSLKWQENMWFIFATIEKASAMFLLLFSILHFIARPEIDRLLYTLVYIHIMTMTRFDFKLPSAAI